MHYYVLTLFPEMITNACGESILGRASQKGLISVEAINIRDYSTNKHNRVDDYPYGGGAGMVMQPMQCTMLEGSDRAHWKKSRVCCL